MKDCMEISHQGSDEQLTVTPGAPTSTNASLPTALHPDNLDSWLSRPTESFALWLDGSELKESSKKVKRAMWGKFCRYLQLTGQDISFCSSQSISTFLDSQHIFRAQRRRYIVLIESVFDHLYSLGLLIANPGQKAAEAGVGRGSNSPMRCLVNKERELLLSGMRNIWEQSSQEKISWPLLRDVAIIGVITGSGAKLSEVAELTVNCSLDDGRLVLCAGQVGEHRAPLLPIGLEALERWERTRASIGIGGRVLFPADLPRRRDDRSQPFQTMHPAQIYRRLDLLFQRFGIGPREEECYGPNRQLLPATKRNGAQTLRNTYAATLFDGDFPDVVVEEALGLHAERSVPRLRDEYLVWKATHSTM